MLVMMHLPVVVGHLKLLSQFLLIELFLVLNLGCHSFLLHLKLLVVGYPVIRIWPAPSYLLLLDTRISDITNELSLIILHAIEVTTLIIIFKLRELFIIIGCVLVWCDTATWHASLGLQHDWDLLDKLQQVDAMLRVAMDYLFSSDVGEVIF
jgi:hypothetical protein